MTKLVDKAKLQELAVGLHGKAKSLVEAEETRATGVEGGLQNAINAINNETTGILAKAKEYTDGKSADLNASVEALEAKDTELQTAIDNEVQARTNAIATLNGADTVEGSVAKKIKDVVDPVKADLSSAQDDISANTTAISNEVARAKAAEKANSDAIATLNGADTVEGSVAKKIKDVVDPVKADVESLQTDVAANTASINAINNETTGILANAKKYADEKITALVDSAPEAMNTLGELATAIQDHNDVYDAYVSTVSTQLDGKVDKESGKRLISETEATAFAAKAEVSDVDDALAEAKSYTDTEIGKVKTSATASDQKISTLESAVGKAAEGDSPATGLFKSVADLETKNTEQDADITAAQTTANKGVADAAAAQTTANNAVSAAQAAQDDIDALTNVVGSGGTTGMSKEIKDNRDAIAVLNGGSTVTGSVDKKIADAINGVNNDLSDIRDDVSANTTAISNEVTRAKAAEKVNSDAIAILNGNSTVAGSVDKKIADTIADYSTTAQMNAILVNVVNSLAATIEDDKLKLKLGGVDGITLHETQIDMCTSADITEILTGLDA